LFVKHNFFCIMEGEVIFFKTPTESSVLYVDNISTNAVLDEMHELFGSFGLLYEIKIFTIENKKTNSAFVKYYSKRSANQAKEALHDHLFCGLPLRVNMSKPRPNSTQFVLDINKSIELANYYIGFNSWTSSILGLSQESLVFEEASGHYRCTYVCKVRLNVADGRFVEAEGKATGGGSDKSTVIEFAKKNAVTDARKKAFEKIALVILFTGKVAVHFLNETLDSWSNSNSTANLNSGNDSNAILDE